MEILWLSFHIRSLCTASVLFLKYLTSFDSSASVGQQEKDLLYWFGSNQQQ